MSRRMALSRILNTRIPQSCHKQPSSGLIKLQSINQ